MTEQPRQDGTTADRTDGTDRTDIETSSTEQTEELTMDEGTTGTARPTGPVGTTGPESTSTTAFSRHTDDDAPWSVPAGTTAGAATAGSTAAPAPEIARGVRVGTVVWGLVVVVAGALLAAAAAGVVFDLQLAVIATVALAGVGLVVGSLVSAGRRRARDA